MSTTSSESSSPDQPTLAIGNTLNHGARIAGWLQFVCGAAIFLSTLALAILSEVSDSGGTGRSILFPMLLGLQIVTGTFMCGFGVQTLQRFPRILITEGGLVIQGSIVPFAAIVDVVKKERTVLSFRYLDQGVTNEALLGVSWVFGSDLAPVARWLASRAESARASQANQRSGTTAS